MKDRELCESDSPLLTTQGRRRGGHLVAGPGVSDSDGLSFVFRSEKKALPVDADNVPNNDPRHLKQNE